MKVVAAAGVTAAMLLAGCAGAPAAVTAPAAGQGSPTLSTDAFTLVRPAGWADAGADRAAVGALHAPGKVLVLLVGTPAAALPGHGAVRPTLSVSVVGDGPIPASAMPAYLANVAAAGATGVSAAQYVSVGGVTGESVTYGHSIAGMPGLAQDVVVTRAGTTYEIVVDSAAPQFGAADEALGTVLQSWRWH